MSVTPPPSDSISPRGLTPPVLLTGCFPVILYTFFPAENDLFIVGIMLQSQQQSYSIFCFSSLIVLIQHMIYIIENPNGILFCEIISAQACF